MVGNIISCSIHNLLYHKYVKVYTPVQLIFYRDIIITIEHKVDW